MNWIEKFGLSVYAGNKESCVILHSPLARKEIEIPAGEYECVKDDETAPEKFMALVDYIPFDKRPAVRTPADYTLLTVLPNNQCNFQCSYCYSAGCRNSIVLDKLTLRAAIDFFIDSKHDKPSRRKLTISFMGGGEPMLSWDVVKDGIEYAQGKAAAAAVGIQFRIITNGSLITGEEIDFILKHSIGVSVSFEVLEDIQNLQRKHYDTVSANLRRLLDAGVDVQLNVTVTKANVDRMEETLMQIADLYPEVKNAMFEAVTDPGSFPTVEDLTSFLDRYTTGFIRIRELGDRLGIEITSFPYLRTIFPLKRACPGELCLTAEGYLTGCYCVSTKEHPLFNLTHYGDVDRRGVTVDKSVYEALMNENVESRPECRKCSARWNCGGGCFHAFNSYPEEMRAGLCDFTRKFVEECVRYKIRKYGNN